VGDQRPDGTAATHCGCHTLFPNRTLGLKVVAVLDDCGGDPPLVTRSYLEFRFCAQCGSTRLMRSQTTDYAHDRLYHFIKCDDCGWDDWSE
jgi:predicted RNA-binding Zn-ribbon protein involved in translation (DUF1610 family)